MQDVCSGAIRQREILYCLYMRTDKSKKNLSLCKNSEKKSYLLLC